MSLAKEAAVVTELNCVKSKSEVPLVKVCSSEKTFCVAEIEI
jgi:hypothetical protein